MNERIREFIKQAGGDFMVAYVDETDANPTEVSVKFNPPETLDKFVELIVRDVTETAAKYRQSKTRPVGWNFRATILNHYGLEEFE